MKTLERRTADEVAMEALGAGLARALAGRDRASLITVQGALGAGKTTLIRGLLRGFGHEGAVKSPTFTLVEPYVLRDLAINHFDLYRVKSPEELEFVGFRDYLRAGALCVVEWPERAGALLPKADIEITIGVADGERRVQLTADGPRGEAALEALA